MKKILLALLLCFTFQINYSQETYIINGETLELKTEIDGNLDLLWNTINNEYRYFVRTKDGSITELKNTKSSNKTYLEEYKATLEKLTNGLSTEKLKFTRFDLRNYIDTYNTSANSAYSSNIKKSSIGFRLGFSGGITNNPFIINSDNIKVPMIGAELEFFEAKTLPRHSGFMQARHTLSSNDLDYSTTELSLGYRYKIINTSTFSIYGQLKLATLNFADLTSIDSNNMEVDSFDISLDLGLIFGIGSDIKVGENSFITIIYGELFGIITENQGNFSTDIAIGYKFNL